MDIFKKKKEGELIGRSPEEYRYYKKRFLSNKLYVKKILAGISCREVKCLSRPTYGWEENIENKSCNTKEEIERYYFRLGIHLFLGYALGATDLHGENIVAHGEHPVIIDMETYPGYITKNNGSSTEEKAEIKIREKIMTPVLNTGILRAVSTLFHNEREKKICLCHGMTGNLLTTVARILSPL